jgi:hypothetical protein
MESEADVGGYEIFVLGIAAGGSGVRSRSASGSTRPVGASDAAQQRNYEAGKAAAR